MVSPNLKEVLIGLRGNEKAIAFMYNRLFSLRPDLKTQYYERVCELRMFDKVVDILLEDIDDSEIDKLRSIHSKLDLTRKEFQLYTTMFIDTAITFCNKLLDRETLRALYSRCDYLIKRLS